MEHLMQANLQIIELLGAVFEEVERHEMRTAPYRQRRPSPLRCCVGRPRQDDDDPAPHAHAI